MDKEKQEIINLIDTFVAEGNKVALAHWNKKGVQWISDLIREKVIEKHGEVFYYKIKNMGSKLVRETTTTASVGGQYTSPFFLMKRKMNEDGSETLEYGTYRDLFKHIVRLQRQIEDDDIVNELNILQLDIVNTSVRSVGLDAEVSADDMEKYNQKITELGLSNQEDPTDNNLVSGDVENDKIVNEKITNLSLFEMFENVIKSLDEGSHYISKIEKILEGIINVDDPHGEVSPEELHELYNVIREIENDGQEDDYFYNEITVPTINENKLKADEVLKDAHKENDKNTPEEFKEFGGEAPENIDVDSENQKPDSELTDAEKDFQSDQKGMQDIEYENISQQDKERHKELIDYPTESKSTEDQFGNKTPKMDNPNALKTDVAKDMIKTADEESQKNIEDLEYTKEPKAVRIVKETQENDSEVLVEGEDYSITRGEMKVIKEEVNTMKKFIDTPRKNNFNRVSSKKDIISIMRELNKK